MRYRRKADTGDGAVSRAMACLEYTGYLAIIYDWQTMIAGIVAVGGGGLAYWAGVKQANATKEQTAAVKQQNADLKRAEQRSLARERFAVAGLLYTALGVVVGQIETARSKFSSGPANAPIDEQSATSIRHEVGKPGFAYLWERLGVIEGAIVAGFLSLEIAIDRMHAEKRSTQLGPLTERLDNLSELAESLRSLASGEMERAKAILPVDDLPPPQ